MKNMIKKNQLMITALAIMIAIAGYLQFAENTADKEKNAEGKKEASTGNVITENYVAGSGQGTDALDGILDLSEEDLLKLTNGEADGQDRLDVASLDTDVNVVLEDYLEDDMDITSVDEGKEPVSATPQEGEIPGEAVFTSTVGMGILSDAKLLKEQTRAKNRETLLEIINSTALSDDQKQSAVASMVQMTEVAEREAAAEILLEAKGFSDVVVSISGDGVDVVVNAVSLTDAQRAQIEDIVKRKTNVSPENIIISTVVKD